jgi:hypothetical protein
MLEQASEHNETGQQTPSDRRPDRRQFLQQLSAGAVAAVGSQFAMRAAGAGPDNSVTARTGPAALPTIKLGSCEVTRLIVGSNPVEGYSHSSRALSQHMLEYFTPERTLEFISRCEQAGINTWQSGHGPSDKVLETLKRLRQRGSRIQWMCLAYEGSDVKPIKEVLPYKPVAMVHHGGETDKLFHAGKREQVHDFVKKVHDAGIMSGVSSHNPANIAYIEDQGWENEFFMTCFYQVSRPAEEIREKLGTVPLDEAFLESDRNEMTAVIQQVKRPCLAFKILAAGRLCESPVSVESAFRYAFSRIKRTDGVIVGMYPRFSDEIAMNTQLTLRYGRPS